MRAEGKSDAEKLRVDMAEQQFADFRMNWVRLCYNPDFVSTRRYLPAGPVPAGALLCRTS